MQEKSINFRIFKDRVWMIAIAGIALVVLIPLIFILYYLIKNGISSISIQFFFSLPKPVGETGGGIANAIVGTGILILLASAIAIPPGVLAGIYLTEYPQTKLSYLVRVFTDILHGVPSIVIGIFAWVVLVLPMKSFSALSGGFALAVMMLPVIVKSTEETLKLVPATIKEASLALGVSYPGTIMKVVVRSGLSGIINGILLSTARISGETAPLLFTAFGNPFMNVDITKPVHSLPLIIYNYATSPYPEWHKLAWGASFILILFVLVLNLVSKLVIRK